MLRYEQVPELVDPVMVFAFTGWVDAGFAGAGAISALVEQIDDPIEVGRYELSDLLDFQQTRPTVKIVDGGIRRIDWPHLRIVAGRVGRDVLVVSGPEPSLRWPTVASDLAEMAARFAVSFGVSVGAMPVLGSHRRPIGVLATATSRSVAQESGAIRPDYTGPTGLNTVLQQALGSVGIPAVGLWAQVPQYVSGSPSPPAVRALLGRVAELTRLTPDLRPLDARCDEYRRRVDEGLAQRPDVAELVERLEAIAPAGMSEDELPSGEELVDEIERFLRDQST